LVSIGKKIVSLSIDKKIIFLSIDIKNMFYCYCLFFFTLCRWV